MTANIHIVNCDAPPCLMSGVMIYHHKKMGMLNIIPEMIKLYSYYGGDIHDSRVEEILLGEAKSSLLEDFGLNANVVDYLYNNQQIIPESWKGKKIYFFNTVFKPREGSCYINYLEWQWWHGCNPLWIVGQEHFFSILTKNSYFAIK